MRKIVNIEKSKLIVLKDILVLIFIITVPTFFITYYYIEEKRINKEKQLLHYQGVIDTAYIYTNERTSRRTTRNVYKFHLNGKTYTKRLSWYPETRGLQVGDYILILRLPENPNVNRYIEDTVHYELWDWERFF